MHPYKIAGLGLGAVGLLFGCFMIVGILLPGGWEAERTIDIQAHPQEVFPFVNGANQWEEWTPSPESGIELFGPTAGIGSGRRWDDPAYGQGEFLIVDSDLPTRVAYQVVVEDGAIEIRGLLELEQVPDGTRILWREEGNFGWNPLLGYLATRMNELQGAQLDASLTSLKELVESRVRSQPGQAPRDPHWISSFA